MRAERFGSARDRPGADPGPACYGRGGTEPTVTDAQVVLGRLDPEQFLGGDLRIEPALAHQAVEDAASPRSSASAPSTRRSAC